MNALEGILTYDDSSKRYQVQYKLNNYAKALSSGERLQVFGCDNEWHDSRIEYSHETNSYYLVGFGRHFQLSGARVRY